MFRHQNPCRKSLRSHEGIGKDENFEVRLRNEKNEVVYTSMVPEIHVKEKVDHLFQLNKVEGVGGIDLSEIGTISDRYIVRFLHKEDS